MLFVNGLVGGKEKKSRNKRKKQGWEREREGVRHRVLKRDREEWFHVFLFFFFFFLFGFYRKGIWNKDKKTKRATNRERGREGAREGEIESTSRR
jgi:hypothetical protein